MPKISHCHQRHLHISISHSSSSVAWGPEGWSPEGWEARNFAFFFFLSRHNFHYFFPLFGDPFVEFWLCLKRRGPQMCTLGVLGQSCEAPAAPRGGRSWRAEKKKKKEKLIKNRKRRKYWYSLIFHVSTHEHATRDPTTQQQGWRSDLVSPWRLDHTRGSRQDIHSTRVPGSPGRLWMARLPPQTTSDRTRPLRRLRTNSNMVAEPETKYGLAFVE